MEGSSATLEENNEFKAKLLEKLAVLNVDGDWEEMADCHMPANDTTPNSMKAYRRDGESSSGFTIKIEQYFPNIDHDTFFELMTNVEERSKWDSRWENLEIVEQDKA